MKAIAKFKFVPDLIQAVFHVTAFGREQIGAQKIKEQFFFYDKFYSLKAHAHYFNVFIYLATWRAAKLGIFTHFTSTTLPWCSQSILSLIYVYYADPQPLLWAFNHSHDRTSPYYRRPKKFSVLPPDNIHCSLSHEVKTTRKWNLVS